MNKKTKKRLWRWGTLLLVVILAVWVQSRWHAWFYNPEEQPYTPLTVPHRVLLIQRWMFDDVIREYGVDLVLQGHEHAYARVTGKDDGGQRVTPIYTISHCSPKNYKIDPGDRFDKIDKEGRYYQIVSVSGDILTM